MIKNYLFALMLLISTAIHAQIVEVRGVGTTTYPRVFNQDEKEKAYRAAQLAAVERYFAEWRIGDASF